MVRLIETLNAQAPAWVPYLLPVLKTEKTALLESLLHNSLNSEKSIYPENGLFFGALSYVKPGEVKAVILGQDPYHGPGQAHGLSFSVKRGVRIPPSLRNIYKELSEDIDCPAPMHGNLEAWAKQGVLMLNSVLTVERNAAGSHAKRGWEEITDAIISTVNVQKEPTAFVLWGKYAQEKAPYLDKRHLAVRSAHPSPFAARKGFFGSRPFSKVNDFLMKNGRDRINWAID